ncbi:MAG: Fe-S-containing hydro-lyase [Desulfobacteraceae bacterium]|nr:Fe-S-containing hydro-lyase [Desulfobacteraceae bacterium]
MGAPVYLQTPFDAEVIKNLKAGDRVLLSGIIYTARDAAHKRLVAALESGESLPFDLDGQVIYYVGPTPAKPGMTIGAAGPTTSYRMDPYTPRLIENGLKGMIGKGMRAPFVKEAMHEYKAVYMAAIGGAGALMAKTVRSAEIIAYSDLGTEAVRRLVVENMPLIVINDIYGGDLYEEGVKAYRRAS